MNGSGGSSKSGSTFFDVHCHAIHLGHPNILALLARRRQDRGGLAELLFGPYTAFLLRRPGQKFRNLTRLSFYSQLAALLRALPDNRLESVTSRLLFGSDFPLSLIDAESYAHYVGRLAEAPLDATTRHRVCSLNPSRFLFGE